MVNDLDTVTDRLGTEIVIILYLRELYINSTIKKYGLLPNLLILDKKPTLFT